MIFYTFKFGTNLNKNLNTLKNRVHMDFENKLKEIPWSFLE